MVSFIRVAMVMLSLHSNRNSKILVMALCVWELFKDTMALPPTPPIYGPTFQQRYPGRIPD